MVSTMRKNGDYRWHSKRSVSVFSGYNPNLHEGTGSQAGWNTHFGEKESGIRICEVRIAHKFPFLPHVAQNCCESLNRGQIVVSQVCEKLIISSLPCLHTQLSHSSQARHIQTSTGPPNYRSAEVGREQESNPGRRLDSATLCPLSYFPTSVFSAGISRAWRDRAVSSQQNLPLSERIHDA